MKLLILFIIIFTITYGYAEEYLVIQKGFENKIHLYEKPDNKSKVIKYEFKNEELIFSVSNIVTNGNKWYYAEIKKNITGWIPEIGIYNISQDINAKYYLEIMRREEIIISNTITRNYFGIEFHNLLDKNYIALKYELGYGNDYFRSLDMYKLDNTNLIKVIHDVSFEEIYIYNKYIILFSSKDFIDIFDTEQFKPDPDKWRNPSGKLYKMIFGYNLENEKELENSNNEYYDSHMEYNETNGILTVYLRKDEFKPFIIKKYQFKEGKFLAVTN